MQITPRLQIFLFERKKFWLAVSLVSSIIFLFAMSWLYIFSLSFPLNLNSYIVSITGICLFSFFCAYHSFHKVKYTKYSRIIGKYTASSLYAQVNKKYKFIYSFLLSMLLVFAIDVFIILAQYLQFQDNFFFFQLTPLLIILFSLRYVCMLIFTLLFIICYKLKFPHPPLYTPFALREEE